MDILMFSLNATLPLVLCMALGTFLHSKDFLDTPTTEKLSELCFSVFLPALLFYNIYTIDFDLSDPPLMLAFASAGIIVMITLLALVMRLLVKDRKKFAAYMQVCYRSNYLMFGIALSQNMFGDSGVRLTSILVALAVVPFNFVTVFLYSRCSFKENMPFPVIFRKATVEILKNPLIIASLSAIAAAFFKLSLPIWLDTTVKNVSVATTPLCLIVLGSQIDWKSLRGNLKTVLLITSVRLIIIPVPVLLLAVISGFRGPELGALFALFATPCANSCVIMARQYDVEPQFTAQVSAMTTVCSCATIFFGVSLLRYLALF